jgi:hypothetical protein
MAGLHDTLTLARFFFHPSTPKPSIWRVLESQTCDGTVFYGKCHNGLRQLDSQLALIYLSIGYATRHYKLEWIMLFHWIYCMQHGLLLDSEKKNCN